MIHTAASLDEAFNARFAQSATIPEISGSADLSVINDYQPLELSAAAEKVGDIAAVGVTSFQQVTDTLVWVRVVGTHGFRVAGTYIPVGDFVQLKKGDANLQVTLGRAEFVSDAEVASQQKGKGK